MLSAGLSVQIQSDGFATERSLRHITFLTHLILGLGS